MAMGCCLFKRPRHRAIEALLRALDQETLAQARCYFGGGTAVALLVDEFRESADVDFVCSDGDGFRRLRSMVFEGDLDALFKVPVRKLRETRLDRDGIRNFVEIEGTPIKLELVQEARIGLSESNREICGVRMLSCVDLFAEKLLANADRGLDVSASHRDAIDLLALMTRNDEPMTRAFAKAEGAYGVAVRRIWSRVLNRLRDDPATWSACMESLGIADGWPEILRRTLDEALQDDV